MTQERLSNNEFFSKLSELLMSRKTRGSVILTQKRLTHDSSNPVSTKAIPSRVTRSPKSTTPHPSKTSKTPATTIHVPAKPHVPTDLSDLTPPETPLPILIRASNALSNDVRHKGKHIKIATLVEADELDAFFVRYAEVWKSGLTQLKKRDRKKAKAKGKKKKAVKGKEEVKT